jgi:hypothetical protein
MTNPFTMIPAALRLTLYMVVAFGALILGAIQVYQANAFPGSPQPSWMDGALAVVAYILTPLAGITAASNVSDPTPPPEE